MPHANPRLRHVRRNTPPCAAFAAIALALTLLLAPPPANAQNADAIINALMPKPAQNAAPPKRSAVRSFRPQSTRGITISGGTAPPREAMPRINLIINFEFDSHRLTIDGWIALQELGRALGDPRLAGEIAGHTDGRGNAGYNRALSERRAVTVADHLARYYAVDRQRLFPVGYGESRLFDPSNPERDINRRVEIINLTPVF